MRSDSFVTSSPLTRSLTVRIPQPGSLGEAEIKSFSRPQSVHTAQSQAWILVEVTSDQLTAFIKTVTDPVETIAPYTCVRSLLEGAALACWLFDPAIDVADRIARSMSFRYEGMLQQQRWARAAGEDPARAKRRLAEIAAEGTAAHQAIRSD